MSVGGVEPETVTVAREDYVPPSAFRRVEEELRQAREERDAYRASWEREATDAARYRLHHEACVRQRDKARKAATGWVEDVSSMAARVDDMAGDLRACRAALDWYAKEDRYDVGRASSRPVVLADRGLLARRALAALSPVQGEHEQDGDRWSAANCESCCKLGRPCGVHMRLGGRAQDGDTEETT